MARTIELVTGNEIQVIERPVYRIRGARRDYFDERTALNKLAFIIADREFKAEGKATNYPDEKIILEGGIPSSKRGDMTPEYLERVNIILGNLKELMKKERRIKQLQKKYDKAIYEQNQATAKVICIQKEIIEAQNQ